MYILSLAGSCICSTTFKVVGCFTFVQDFPTWFSEQLHTLPEKQWNLTLCLVAHPFRLQQLQSTWLHRFVFGTPSAVLMCSNYCFSILSYKSYSASSFAQNKCKRLVTQSNIICTAFQWYWKFSDSGESLLATFLHWDIVVVVYTTNLCRSCLFCFIFVRFQHVYNQLKQNIQSQLQVMYF